MQTQEPRKADSRDSSSAAVIVNGVAVSAEAIASLERDYATPIQPGRYWMNAQGIGGVEGGPALFDLGAVIAAQSKNGRGWNRTTPGGHLGGDDTCFYYFDPASGSSVMNCK